MQKPNEYQEVYTTLDFCERIVFAIRAVVRDEPGRADILLSNFMHMYSDYENNL